MTMPPSLDQPPELVLPAELDRMLARPPTMTLSKRPPKLIKCAPLPHPRSIVRQPYYRVPGRALMDKRLTDRPHLLMCLAAVAVNASALGITYAGLTRIGAVVNRSYSWAQRYVTELERMGYLRRLRSKPRKKGRPSKYKSRTIRRQVLFLGNDPLPSAKEQLDDAVRARQAAEAPPAPIFNSPTEAPTMQRPMNFAEANDFEKILKRGLPINGRTPEISAQLRRYEMYKSALQGDAWRVADHCAAALSGAGRATTNDLQVGVALKWMRSGVSVADAIAQIDRVIAEHQARGKLPPEHLGKIPPPAVNGAKAA
jgi:hypothetical protein